MANYLLSEFWLLKELALALVGELDRRGLDKRILVKRKDNFDLGETYGRVEAYKRIRSEFAFDSGWQLLDPETIRLRLKRLARDMVSAFPTSEKLYVMSQKSEGHASWQATARYCQIAVRIIQTPKGYECDVLLGRWMADPQRSRKKAA